MQQLYYTSCVSGQSVTGDSGFQIRASSTYDVGHIALHSAPINYQVIKESDEPPPSRLSLVVDSNGQKIVVHSTYVAEESDKGRPHTFFTHLIFDLPPEFDSLDAISALHSSFWKEKNGDYSTELDSIAEKEEFSGDWNPTPVRLETKEAAKYFLGNLFGDLFNDEYVKDRFVLFHSRPEEVAEIVRLVSSVLPAVLRGRLSFSTSEPNPRWAPCVTGAGEKISYYAHIVGCEYPKEKAMFRSAYEDCCKFIYEPTESTTSEYDNPYLEFLYASLEKDPVEINLLNAWFHELGLAKLEEFTWIATVLAGDTQNVDPKDRPDRIFYSRESYRQLGESFLLECWLSAPGIKEELTKVLTLERQNLAGTMNKGNLQQVRSTVDFVCGIYGIDVEKVFQMVFHEEGRDLYDSQIAYWLGWLTAGDSGDKDKLLLQMFGSIPLEQLLTVLKEHSNEERDEILLKRFKLPLDSNALLPSAVIVRALEKIDQEENGNAREYLRRIGSDARTRLLAEGDAKLLELFDSYGLLSLGQFDPCDLDLLFDVLGLTLVEQTSDVDWNTHFVEKIMTRSVHTDSTKELHEVEKVSVRRQVSILRSLLLHGTKQYYFDELCEMLSQDGNPEHVRGILKPRLVMELGSVGNVEQGIELVRTYMNLTRRSWEKDLLTVLIELGPSRGVRNIVEYSLSKKLRTRSALSEEKKSHSFMGNLDGSNSNDYIGVGKTVSDGLSGSS